MPRSLDTLTYRLLRAISPHKHTDYQQSSASYYNEFVEAQAHLFEYFGDDFSERVKNKVVMDFGCGPGYEAIHIAHMGAAKVIGVDIQEKLLKHARELAISESITERCEFHTETEELADLVISKDAFEHFENPAQMLELMAQHLKPNGEIEIVFGPTWLHPYGGHLFSIFPWSHLIFSEAALIRWRADFKFDGASKFSEVAGGLNQMTIKEFETIVANSSCELISLDTVPIKKLKFLKLNMFREIGSSLVRCRLIKKTN